MALNSRLPEFLAREAARPWDHGAHNCGLWLADWAMVALEIPDPAAELRERCVRMGALAFGKYSPLREIASVCAALGLPRTSDPMCGDIGFVSVRVPEGLRISGAIMGRRGWIVPAIIASGDCLGLARPEAARVKCRAAWRVDECLKSSPSS